MSVDISRLAAHLAPQQQEAIRKEYRKRAWHDTTAFLLCFFGGIFGAHRFYLHQYALGLLHLILPVAALVVLVGGIATGMGPAIIAIIVVILLLIALVWSLVDLFRIDDEVYAHNLKLAERLIAQAMLGDHSVERAAMGRMEDLRHEAAATSAAAAATAAGRAAETDIEYRATTVTDASAPASEQERLDAHQQPESWTQAEQVPIGGYGPQVQETVTHSHEVTPQSVTDSVETVRTFEPQVPLGASPDDTQPAAPAPLDLDPTTAPASAFAAPEPIASDAPTWPEHPPLEYEVPLVGAAAGLAAAAALGAAGAAHEHDETPAEQGKPAIDYTDLGAGDDAHPGPVADIAEARSAPQRVTLPPEPAAAYDPYATASAPPTPAPVPLPPADDATLVLVPDNLAPETRAADPVPAASPAPSVWDVPTERYTPPAPADEAQTAAAANPPQWPVPESQPPAEPQPATHDEPPTMPYDALAGGAAGAALAGGAAAYEAAHHAPADETPAQAQPEPQAEPQPPHQHHQLRRVRVTRQVVVDGKVVDETAAEELIPADADPEPVRARLQERLKIQAEARERELGGQS